MTFSTSSLTHKNFFASQFLFICLGGIQAVKRVKLGGRWKINDVLHLCHHCYLICTIREMNTFASSAHMVAIKICSALFKFRKVFNRSKRALRTMDLLVEQTAQAS